MHDLYSYSINFGHVVIYHVDPDMGSLPESYFLDTEDNSGNSLSDSEEQHQPLTPSGRTRNDSGSFNRYMYSVLPSIVKEYGASIPSLLIFLDMMWLQAPPKICPPNTPYLGRTLIYMHY